MPFAPAALVALTLLAGCASSPGEADLALACQFRPCTCADATALIWQAADTKPVEWRENGDAGCPPGFTLKVTDPPARAR
jgi:hypothetical protein